MDQESNLYLRYVDLSRKEGLNSEQVRKSLISEGWTKSQIDELITTKHKRIIGPSSNHSNSLLSLRLKNGKLFMKVLAVMLVGIGVAYVWKAQASKTDSYQSVFTSFTKAIELNNHTQVMSLVSQSEKHLLGSSNLTYNSCNASPATCSLALTANNIKKAQISSLNYSAAGGIKGKEQVFSEKAVGCASSVINVDVIALPFGNSWEINSINIVKSPSDNSCVYKGTPAASQPPSPSPANNTNQATQKSTSESSKSANNKSNTPQGNANNKSQASGNTDGLLPVSLSIGNTSLSL